MKINFVRNSVIVFTLLVVVSTVFAQKAAPKETPVLLRQNLQAKLDEWHKNGKFAGATLGVCTADGNCFGLAVGLSDLESKTPMKPTDLMLAGSVGKTYAAAVALQLVKEGKINLPIKKEKHDEYIKNSSCFSHL